MDFSANTYLNMAAVAAALVARMVGVPAQPRFCIPDTWYLHLSLFMYAPQQTTCKANVVFLSKFHFHELYNSAPAPEAKF